MGRVSTPPPDFLLAVQLLRRPRLVESQKIASPLPSPAFSEGLGQGRRNLGKPGKSWGKNARLGRGGMRLHGS